MAGRQHEPRGAGPGPLVSVVIPCYNAEAFVGEAIESALGQAGVNREVIVVDDGSTDQSLAVIRAFGDSVRWRTGPNRGGGAARNLGLGLALSQFIQFLDADDVLLPDKLSRQVARLEQEGGDVCVGRFKSLEGNRYTLGGPRDAPIERPTSWFLNSDIRLSPLYRADIIAAVNGFDESLPCCQDFDLNLRIALQGARFVYDDGVEYEYRRRPGSVSSDERRLYRVMTTVLGRAGDRLNQEPEPREPELRAVAAKASSCGRWLLRFGDVDGGLSAFEVAKAIHASGGVDTAYSWPARALRAVLGPASAERVLWRLRRLRNRQLWDASEAPGKPT